MGVIDTEIKPLYTDEGKERITELLTIGLDANNVLVVKGYPVWEDIPKNVKLDVLSYMSIVGQRNSLAIKVLGDK